MTARHRHVFVKQLRVLEDELADGSSIVAPDGVRHVAGEDEARPACQAVASGESQLCIGELGVSRIDAIGVMVVQIFNGLSIATANGA
jgi:hypothetical protein